MHNHDPHDDPPARQRPQRYQEPPVTARAYRFHMRAVFEHPNEKGYACSDRWKENTKSNVMGVAR